MSYYPSSFYGNYQYPQYQTSTQPIATSPQSNVIQGKIIDNEEMVKVTDVPFGTYSVFPKADMSAVYIKTWNSNGTTSILTFKPVEQEKKADPLLERISNIETKIDTILSQQNVKKELNANAY